MENNSIKFDLSTDDLLPADTEPGHGPAVQPTPVTKEDRIGTIDMVRGFALCGILLMNILGFSTDGSTFEKVIEGPHNNADYITLGAIFTFFDGTMRGLFSMLFGAGMILFTLNKHERDTGPRVADYYYRRLLWLVLFGVFNAFVLLWQGDILFYYGLTGMLLYPFRKSAPKLLITIGLLCFLINSGKTYWQWTEMKDKRIAYLEVVAAEKENRKLTSKQEEAKATWVEMEKGFKMDTARSNRNIRKMHSGYPTIFEYFIPNNANGEAWGMYHGIWDFIGMMFIGMGLYYLGFFSNKISTSTYLMILMLGYTLGITIGYVTFRDAVSQTDFTKYIDTYRVPHWVLYDLRRLLISCGHAALLMLVYRSKLVPWLMRALANVGQMAFTNYLMQSIMCTLFFYGYGLDYYNKMRVHQVYYVVFAIWIIQLIWSSIWLRYFRFGPFEWVWRSLTYWKRQPMKLSQK